MKKFIPKATLHFICLLLALSLNFRLTAQLTISYNSASGTGSSVNTLTSVPAGALLVLACQSETAGYNATVTSSPSLTWTKQADAQATGSGDCELYTAVFTAGGNITITSDFNNFAHSSVCYVITGQESTLGGQIITATGQSAPSVNITTTRANSIIIAATCDYNAVNGSSRTYRSSPTEAFYHHVTNVTTYNYYKSAPTTTTYTMGLSAPTGQSSGTILYEVRVPQDNTAPSAPTLSSPAQSSSTIDLSWTAATDNIGVVGYDIYVNGSGSPTATTANTTYTLTGLSASTTYSIVVKARDAAGNVTSSNTITPSTTAAPSSCVSIVNISTATGSGSSVNSLTNVPAGALLVLTCQAETSGYNATVTSSPSLTWTRRADAQATGSGDCELFTAVFSAGGNINITSTFNQYAHSSVCYVITGQESTLGGAVVTANSQTAPAVNITTTRNNSVIIGAINDWTAKNGSSRAYRDNPTESFYHFIANIFTTYNFYKTTGTAGTYTEGLTAPTNESSGVILYEVRCPSTPDVTAPTAPAITSPAHSSTTITINISGATDNVAVTGYDVYVGTNPPISTPNTTYVITGLTPATTYSIYVKAKDAAGNVSPASNTLNVTTDSAGTCTRNNVIFEATFEGSNPFGPPIDLSGHQYCCSYSITQSTDHARAGLASMKIDLRKTDPDVSASKRAEIEETVGTPVEGIRWYGGSWFLTSPWTRDGYSESILQWHDADGTAPPMGLLVHEDSVWLLTIINGHIDTYGIAYVPSIQGTWMDIVIQVKWTVGNTGFINVWVNGVQKINLTNRRTNSNGSYMKIGMNKFIWHDNPNASTTTQRIFYIDEFRVGNENATYNDVAPCPTDLGFKTNKPVNNVIPETRENTAYSYLLAQNKPNPFNGQTTIQYSIPVNQPVNISMFDVNGRLVKVLVNANQSAGLHSINVNTGSLPKGVYYYKMRSGEFTDVKKLVIQ